MDHSELYTRCSDGFAAVLGKVGDRWSDPTPLPGWDVRTLVHHVVTEERWTPPLLAGATIAEVGTTLDGDLLGDDPHRAAVEAADAALAAVRATPDRFVHLSTGLARSPEYVVQLAADHLVHTWDLAHALGVDATLDPAAVDAVAAWFTLAEQAYRDAGLVGPRTAPADATPQSQLLAAFGRTS